MMLETVRNFPEQLQFRPTVMNASHMIQTYKRLIVCGMGGSHLSADMLALLRTGSVRAVHSDYELPSVTDAEALWIMSSYSGNTEEVLSAYECARSAKLPIAVVAAGGKLIACAQRDSVPYIELPATGIQPRAALGYGVIALATLLHDEALIDELRALSFDIARQEEQGRDLAVHVADKIPLIYASGRNGALAQNWKIKINENAKTPAFWNVIPELNHNEMTGFDTTARSRKMAQHFSVIMLRDNDDYQQNKKRFAATAALYAARGVSVVYHDMSGATRAQKLFNTLLVGDFLSIALGELYGGEIEQVPMVEEFKRQL